ncbi:MAG: 3-deoxy-7-phosphoheptulonate synthase, partial [Clostridia bacterium]|nr:3-deoxy-7-phosphoheptulonate synthase [Clostridia bacterium]
MGYKLAARQGEEQTTLVEVKGVTIGGKELVVMAGPCAVESEKQIVDLAVAMKRIGARILRGGAFKPRTSPYAFQGLAEDGLKMLASAREVTGLPVVTEVMDTRDLETVYHYADIIQIGSRNMQNFALLKEVGTVDKPVLLKRGLSATLEEWIMAAEYILAAGNHQVILCERGIRTFETFTRNTMDVGAIPAAKH